MKICHVTTVHPSRYDVRIFEKECSSLAMAGYDVTLLVNDELPDEEKNSVKIISLGIRANNRLKRMTVVLSAALDKALSIDADVYHIHDPELLKLGVGIKRRNKAKKVIFDSHEFTAIQIRYKPYIPSFLRKPVSSIYRKYESACLNKIDGMVQPCTYGGQDFFDKVNIPKVIVGNLPRVENFQTIDRHNVDYNKVCYVGGLTEIRGLFHMIKASYIAGKTLVLIGNIDKGLREKMTVMPEYECVEYLGVLPHDKAMKEVAKCGVGLSLLEPVAQYVNLDNLPTKVYEYMIMGIPVVMSDIPFWKKTLHKYRFGEAVNPFDHEKVATAINRICSDRATAESMGEEGKRAIYEELNWQKDADKLIEFYKAIAK